MAIRCLLLAACLFLSPAIHASSILGFPLMEPRLFPEYPSPRDKRYIGFYDHCGEGGITEPVRLVPRSNGIGYQLDLTVGESDFLCFATPPAFAKTLHLVELPRNVPINHIYVTLTRFGQLLADEEIRVISPWDIPPSIAGAWNNPLHPAQGVYFAFTRAPNGAAIAGEAITMTWTTYDAQGKPIWLTGISPIRSQSTTPNYSVDIPLYATTGGRFPGRTDVPPALSVWGTARVEYLACDRLRLQWFPVDGTAFPPGAMELQQLIYSATNPCDLDRSEFDHSRSVRVVVPVVE
jgi:hypothetical protein